MPLLVVVTGMPAAGKTTLARELAARLELPLVEKDEIKETLFDTLGVGDVDWSRRLGGAVYPLNLSLRAPFALRRPIGDRRGELLPRRPRTALRGAPAALARADPLPRSARGAARALPLAAGPPPGHLDTGRADELAERYESGRNGLLDLDGDLIELDTSGPVDVEELTERLRGLF